MNTGEVILEAVEAYQDETGEELIEEPEDDVEDADAEAETEGE